MTPEQAQELLDIANRGETDGQRPVTVAANHAPLAEAAYALAELVANMHYEYAVRTSRDGNDDYVYTSSWYQSYDEAADRAAEVKRVNPHTTIVRRLVSDPEVVE
ncbi:hypothetical protein ACUXOC_000239 [Corynebacterium mucifaciens]